MMRGSGLMSQKKKTDLLVRAVLVIIGTIFIGVAVGIFQSAKLGCDPFSCMNTGVSRRIGWSYSAWQLLVNLVLFIPTLLFFRKAIGFGTVFNMVFVGIFADLSRPFFQMIINDNIILRFIAMLFSVCLLCFGVSLYVAANMGISPYDALSYILEKYFKLNFSWFRIMTDVLCVTVGVIFGIMGGYLWEIVGVGTVITACGTGPVVRFFDKKIVHPFVIKLLSKGSRKSEK